MAARTAAAQVTPVAQLVSEGEDAYKKSNTELAKNRFASIIASRQQVTPAQRITAYKYLGGYWALQSSTGARDSAASFFAAAIDLDPFTDLDRDIFAADEQAAFARTRANMFRVGIQPVEAKALDPSSAKPDSSTYTFHVVSTRAARMVATIVKLNDAANTQEVIATMSNSEGVRDIVWNGLVNNVRADTGLYEFKLDATDGRNQAPPATERQRFRVEHFHARLEDTLPSFRDVNLGGTDTLRSRFSSAKPYTDGAKGLFIASLAAGLPIIAFQTDERSGMSSWKSHFAIGISLGAIAGAGAAWYANAHRDDSRASRENTRRRDERARFNAGVVARNRARLDKTILVIRPLSTAGTAG